MSSERDPGPVDALLAQQDRLLEMLDDQLMTVAQVFIREHTGLEIRRRAC